MAQAQGKSFFDSLYIQRLFSFSQVVLDHSTFLLLEICAPQCLQDYLHQVMLNCCVDKNICLFLLVSSLCFEAVIFCVSKLLMFLIL